MWRAINTDIVYDRWIVFIRDEICLFIFNSWGKILIKKKILLWLSLFFNYFRSTSWTFSMISSYYIKEVSVKSPEVHSIFAVSKQLQKISFQTANGDQKALFIQLKLSVCRKVFSKVDQTKQAALFWSVGAAGWRGAVNLFRNGLRFVVEEEFFTHHSRRKF